MELLFLIVSYHIQGHINPCLRLGKRLARTLGATVTFSATISAHRRMFPGLATPDQEVNNGLITYIPYSDGHDNGVSAATDLSAYFPQIRANGSKTLSVIVRALAERGRPVTCIIHTFAWVADAASDLAIPAALFWIQPATTFAIYYHYFHGYKGVIDSHLNDPCFTVNLSGLPPLRIRELPTLMTITNPDHPYIGIFKAFKEIFQLLDRQKSSIKPKVLVNTFDELEADALSSISTELKLIAVGPTLATLSLDYATKETKVTAINGADLFKSDEMRYMEWLDSKPEKSVVYVAFGSLHVLKKREMEEILRGLRESGRPYLWVVRKDNRSEVAEEVEEANGMVVQWCSQEGVLSHPAVGCFVTHCGWNSTVESLACGVPTVGVPQWMDQGTNARLMELWGTRARAELNSEGVLEGAELRRRVEMVMGEGERGKEMRSRADAWKEKAQEAVCEGGSSDRNLRAFVVEIALK